MDQLGLGLGSGPHVVDGLGSGMGVSASFQIILCPLGRLGLGSGPHIVGRLGSGMWVSASFQIIPRPVGRLGLGLGSEPHVVCRLESGPRVGAGRYVRRVFSLRLSPGSCLQGGGVIS